MAERQGPDFRDEINSWLMTKGFSQDPSAPVKLPSHRWIMAIDFGTVGTGFAVTDKTGKEIFVNKTWDDGVSTTWKTLSCILLDNRGKFIAFGTHAQKKYMQMSEKEAKDMFFFETFKMLLYSTWNESKVTKNTLMQAANGETVSAHVVFAAALSYIKSRVVKHVVDSTGHALTHNDILCVLTVPAIWSDGAKHFMREAAYEAGLVRRNDPDRLLLALEPEAAGIYCRTLPAKDFVTDELQGTVKQAKPGDSYIIVDAGGGTVDIAVHHLDKRGNVGETWETGGPWGGKECNMGFICLLEDIFGADVVAHVKSYAPTSYVDLLKTIEDAKRSWQSTGDEAMHIKLNCDFREALEEYEKIAKSAVQKYATKNRVKIEYAEETLVIPPDLVREILDKPIEAIIEHLEDLLDKPELEDVSRLFLVGGFAESDYLQSRMREAFSSDLQVLIPWEGGLAVLKGAVIFAQNPGVIRERITRFCYGVNKAPKFVEGEHREEYKYVQEGVVRCKNVLEMFVESGQPVETGATITRTRVPVRQGIEGLAFNIYSSPEIVEYVTDPKAKLMARLVVNFPERCQEITDGRTSVIFCFGATEIHVMTIHHKSGAHATTEIDYAAQE